MLGSWEAGETLTPKTLPPQNLTTRLSAIVFGGFRFITWLYVCVVQVGKHVGCAGKTLPRAVWNALDRIAPVLLVDAPASHQERFGQMCWRGCGSRTHDGTIADRAIQKRSKNEGWGVLYIGASSHAPNLNDTLGLVISGMRARCIRNGNKVGADLLPTVAS